MRVIWVGATLLGLGLAPLLHADDTRTPEAARKAEGKTYQVPYRMTTAQHILVRAKINGRGPYNFIVDTGAPALFVSTAVCQKLGVEPDKKGWGTFDRFEIEGGVVIPKASGRIETPFQLDGMNSLGLAGAELHGVIGYNLLARYRITYDFTRDKMTWTELDFDPPAPASLSGKGGPPELNAMAGILKLIGGLLGKRASPEVTPRGFLGLELAAGEGATVRSATGPAAAAGVKPGDRVTEFEGKAVKSGDDLRKLAARVTAGTSVKLTVVRDGSSHPITIQAGEGL
jgi:hypothetical protein